MSIRCSKCGKNNYGDLKKCSFCGAPLVFIPGEEVPEVKEEEVEHKLATMKAKRIRNPYLIGIGGIMVIVGIVIALSLYLVTMFVLFSPDDISSTYSNGQWNYKVPGGEQWVFGKVTKVSEFEDEPFERGFPPHVAYEINGDGVDKRQEAWDAGTQSDIDSLEPDLWVYAEEDTDIGNEGDWVLLRVRSQKNQMNDVRVISDGGPWFGQHGFRSGWIYLTPGILLSLAGIVLALIGIIGKADRSMDRLMEEDKEFRRQQMMLREAARRQMEEKKRQDQWKGYAPVGEGEPSQAQPAEGAPPEAPVAQQYPEDAPQEQYPQDQQNLQAPQSQGQYQSAPPAAQEAPQGQQTQGQYQSGPPAATQTPQGQQSQGQYQAAPPVAQQAPQGQQSQEQYPQQGQ